MITIEANGVFSLGRQGENEYRQIEFDITDLLDGMDLTGAEVVCLLERPHSAPIICNEFTYDLTEKTAVLTVTSAETANSGRCRLELDLVIGDVVGKTQIYACNVLPALGEPTTCTGEIPWVSEVLEASEQAQASAQSASASAQEAQEIADELADTIGTAVEEYLEEHPFTIPVQSVNAQTGDVVLDASDVHALPDSTVIPTKTSDLTNDSGYITSVPVQSVNGKTGAVVLGASDVGALPSSTTIPTKTSQLQNDSGYITSAPVSSVNGQTGDVTITASGLGAYVKPSGGIPKTDLDSAVQTSLGKADTALQTAPVTSVNGQTGDVVIPTATTSANGLMSASDKTLLDSVTERIASTLPVNTVTGAIVNVTDGADDIPVKDLTIVINPVQSGSGDPSPTNVRPISGWTGANVTRTGKNLIPFPYADGNSKTVNGVTFTVSADGSITANGTATANAEFILIQFLDSIYLPPATYTLSGFPSEGSGSTYAINTFAGTVSNSDLWDIRIYKDRTFTPATPINHLFIAVRIISGYTANNLVFKPQLEAGSTATTYEPYTSTTYPIDWQSTAGTVYGGTLDVTTGVLTVDYVHKTITQFDGVFGASTNGYCVYSRQAGTNNLIAQIDEKRMACNMFKYTKLGRESAPLYSYGGQNGATLTQSFILPSSITSLAEANTWLSNIGTAIECTFKLATPQTYQLTPTEVSTLLGANNVWADTGDTTLIYRASLQPVYDDYSSALIALNGE